MLAKAIRDRVLSEEDDWAWRDLLIRYQQADPLGTEELIRKLSPLLFRYFSSMAGARNEAEDLLQECWMRIHRARHTYNSDRPVLPWVFAIARHTRLDAYRRRRRIQWAEVGLGELGASARVSADPARVSRSDLFQLMERLPDSQREVLVMLKYSGMSLEEVARATSSTVGSVKQKAHRAYRKLRSFLRDNSSGTKK